MESIINEVYLILNFTMSVIQQFMGPGVCLMSPFVFLIIFIKLKNFVAPGGFFEIEDHLTVPPSNHQPNFLARIWVAVGIFWYREIWFWSQFFKRIYRKAKR